MCLFALCFMLISRKHILGQWMPTYACLNTSTSPYTAQRSRIGSLTLVLSLEQIILCSCVVSSLHVYVYWSEHTDGYNFRTDRTSYSFFLTLIADGYDYREFFNYSNYWTALPIIFDSLSTFSSIRCCTFKYSWHANSMCSTDNFIPFR